MKHSYIYLVLYFSLTNAYDIIIDYMCNNYITKSIYSVPNTNNILPLYFNKLFNLTK